MRFPTYPPDILSRADALLSEKYPDGIVDPRFVEIACEAMMMEQWRSMDTAPKDGTWFLAHDQFWGRETSEIPTVIVKWRNTGNGYPWVENSGQQSFREDCLSHWQPLPAPPSSPSPGTAE